jgi:signal transduction histidine kinase
VLRFVADNILLMNRTWVRISISFIVVVVFVVILPISIGIVVRFNLGEEIFTKEQLDELQQTYPWSDEEGLGTAIIRAMGQTIITFTVLGIIAGAISSRGLTAPLSRLANAAKAIGERDLSQRVIVRGTQEIMDVSRAFNTMAAQLEEAENLRRSMLADIAHELRTPLSVIQGNLQAILDDVYELDKSEIAHLYDQTRQLSRLVDDLRELAQAEAKELPLDISTVEFKGLLKDITHFYTPILESEGITLHTQIGDGIPVIQGDRRRLMQCIQNLMNNSIRFTSRGGKISLILTGTTRELVLNIVDSGSGIEPDHLPYIFDRFYRTDPARTRETGGSGLGLAITRAIIEAHGGDIRVHSEGDGSGSTFTIRIPVNQEA